MENFSHTGQMTERTVPSYALFEQVMYRSFCVVAIQVCSVANSDVRRSGFGREANKNKVFCFFLNQKRCLRCGADIHQLHGVCMSIRSSGEFSASGYRPFKNKKRRKQS